MLPTKQGTNLETKLLEVRHMSSPKLLNFGSSNSIFKTGVVELVWPPPLEFFFLRPVDKAYIR